LNFNPTDLSSSRRRGEADAKISEADNEIVMKTFSIVETPIPKANNLKVTIGVAELVS
jgi:hypothetical protein